MSMCPFYRCFVCCVARMYRIAANTLPQEDRDQIFIRMVFNHVAGVSDDHNKNFSFLMDENGQGFDDADQKVAQTAAGFLGKQMES